MCRDRFPRSIEIKHIIILIIILPICAFRSRSSWAVGHPTMNWKLVGGQSFLFLPDCGWVGGSVAVEGGARAPAELGSPGTHPHGPSADPKRQTSPSPRPAIRTGRATPTRDPHGPCETSLRVARAVRTNHNIRTSRANQPTIRTDRAKQPSAVRRHPRARLLDCVWVFRLQGGSPRGSEGGRVGLGEPWHREIGQNTRSQSISSS